MNLQPVLVVDKSHLAEAIHEETDPGAGGSDDLGECFLAHFRDHGFRLAFLAEVGQQQQHAGQSFLTGIEELIHEILLNADVARKHVLQE